MSRVVVVNHITLDGVMQSPGRAGEDTRDGFEHGGWASMNADDRTVAAAYARVEKGGGLRLLLGRRTYEEMLGYWNTQDSPFREGLNKAPKYVASRTLREPLPWSNSTLLQGELSEIVTALKRELTGDLTVMGSGELIQTLMHQGLIDEWLLFIHPLVLGTGRRLFPGGGPSADLRLVESRQTPSGVLIASFESAQSAAPAINAPKASKNVLRRPLLLLDELIA